MSEDQSSDPPIQNGTRQADVFELSVDADNEDHSEQPRRTLLDFVQSRLKSFQERLCLSEISGSLGDLGTLIPLLASCAVVGSVRLGPGLFWMGIFNILSGVQWDIPMPVQPMKSIAAVSINEGMSPGAFTAAGIVTGSSVMLLGLTGWIDFVNKLIPGCVIAGMQIGLGVQMSATGCSYWQKSDWLGIDSRVTGLITLLSLVGMMLRTRLPVALIVFTAGIFLAVVQMIQHEYQIGLETFTFPVIIPTAQEWADGAIRGALPQLPLTTLNSVVSVCALSTELFDDKGVSRVSVASSVGIMNVVGCWFGGMPSCHGAGGLAGQYKFGARGGCAVVILGSIKIVLAVLFGATLDAIIQSYPRSVLGILLLFAGVELASVGAKTVKIGRSDEVPRSDDLLACFVTVGGYIGTKNMALGVLAGLVVAAIQRVPFSRAERMPSCL